MKNDDQYAQKVARALDTEAEQLDSETLDKLAQLRQTALGAIPAARAHKPARGLWYGAGTLAASVLLASAILWLPQGGNDSEQLLAERFELLIEGEDLDMLNEDPEFYLWLDAEMNAVPG